MNFMCKACNELFDGESNFIDHFMEKHTARESVDDIIREGSIEQITCNAAALSSLSICVCDVCNKSTPDMDTLAAHILTHVGVFPYFCDTCDFSTISKLHLKQHLLEHNDETALRMIAHSNCEELHKCEWCKTDFPSWKELVCHYVCHLKSMPFTCKECCLMFNEKRDLRIHNHIHNSSTTCNICNLLFNSRENLLHHVLKHNIPKYFSKISSLVDAKGKSVTKSSKNFLKTNLVASHPKQGEYNKTVAVIKPPMKKSLLVNLCNNSNIRIKNIYSLNHSINSSAKQGKAHKPFVKNQLGNSLNMISRLPPNQSELSKKTLPGNSTEEASKINCKKLIVFRYPKLIQSSKVIQKKDSDKELTVEKQRSSNILKEVLNPQNPPVTITQLDNISKKPDVERESSQESSPHHAKNPENMRTVSVVLQRLPSYVHDMDSYKKYCRIQNKRSLKKKKNSTAAKRKRKSPKKLKKVIGNKTKPPQSNSHLDNMRKNLERFNKMYNISIDRPSASDVFKAEVTSVSTTKNCLKKEEYKKSSSIITSVQTKSKDSDISIFSKATTFKTVHNDLVDENCLSAERWKDKSIVDKLVNTAVKIQKNVKVAPQPPLSQKTVSQSLPDIQLQLALVKSLKECSVILDKLPNYVTDMLSYEKYSLGKEIETKSKPLAPPTDEAVADSDLTLLEDERPRELLKYWNSSQTTGKNNVAMNCNNFKLTDHEMPALCSMSKESTIPPVSEQKSLSKIHDSTQNSKTNQKPTEFCNRLPGGERTRKGAKSNYLKQMTAQKLLRTSQFLKKNSEPKKCLKGKKRVRLTALFNKGGLKTKKSVNCTETSLPMATKESSGICSDSIKSTVREGLTMNVSNDDSFFQSNCSLLSCSPYLSPPVSSTSESSDSSDDCGIRLSHSSCGSLSCNEEGKCLQKVKNKVLRRSKNFALSSILPNAKVAKRLNKKKPLQRNKSIKTGVFPSFNFKPDSLDCSLSLKSIQRRIANIHLLLDQLNSKNNSFYFSGCKIPVVSLERLPNSIILKHCKDMAMSNAMAGFQEIQKEKFKSLQTKKEGLVLKDHSYCQQSANHDLGDHSYSAKLISVRHIKFRKDFSLVL